MTQYYNRFKPIKTLHWKQMVGGYLNGGTYVNNETIFCYDDDDDEIAFVCNWKKHSKHN